MGGESNVSGLEAGNFKGSLMSINTAAAAGNLSHVIPTYGHGPLVVSIHRLSAPSCHLLAIINVMGTYFCT